MMRRKELAVNTPRLQFSGRLLWKSVIVLFALLPVLASSSGSAPQPDKAIQTPPTAAGPNAPAAVSAQAPAPNNPPAPATTPQSRRAIDRDFWLVLVYCLVTGLLVVFPILLFIFRQWSFRKDRLFGAIGGDAVVFYYLQFRPGAGIVAANPPGNPPFSNAVSDAYFLAFTKDFYRWYGRRYFFLPVAMLATLTAFAAWWSDGLLHAWTTVPPTGTSLRTLVAAALAGGFTWVISDEIGRLRTRDFTTTDVWNYVFRILLSIPFAWALTLTSVVTGSSATALAFFLGAFPTTTLFTIARRFGSQTLKLGDDPDTGNELEKLQTVTKTNAERFKDEGITTIAGLAHADPIDLTIRTNLEFRYVLDCVSEALVWIYFGDSTRLLVPYSLRGAREVVTILKWTADPAHNLEANQTLTDATAQLNSNKLGMTANSLSTTLNQINNDPYTQFLVNIKV